jgi:hypothetical protein
VREHRRRARDERKHPEQEPSDGRDAGRFIPLAPSPLADRLEIRRRGSLIGLCPRAERGRGAEPHHGRPDKQRGRAHGEGRPPEGDHGHPARDRQEETQPREDEERLAEEAPVPQKVPEDIADAHHRFSLEQGWPRQARHSSRRDGSRSPSGACRLRAPMSRKRKRKPPRKSGPVSAPREHIHTFRLRMELTSLELASGHDGLLRGMPEPVVLLGASSSRAGAPSRSAAALFA